ncbi:hypothetical protein L1049_020049 [Liquidambar formosana]|uniref:Uncharacterized protein n=1 Tax=Liquidambar formosana TaxID=63359 RepID=A0AAP0S982_LIQFO
MIRAGTDSKIGITLGDAAGRSVWVPNLESWGLMGPKHDSYERDNLDIFRGGTTDGTVTLLRSRPLGHTSSVARLSSTLNSGLPPMLHPFS